MIRFKTLTIAALGILATSCATTTINIDENCVEVINMLERVKFCRKDGLTPGVKSCSIEEKAECQKILRVR